MPGRRKYSFRQDVKTPATPSTMPRSPVEVSHSLFLLGAGSLKGDTSISLVVISRMSLARQLAVDVPGAALSSRASRVAA